MSDELRTKIQSVIENEPVALFMKGTPQFVMCGNSERALQALRGWPTIPQVFINGELVGGADITEELAETGDLERKLADAFGENYRERAGERVVSVLVPA